MKPRRLIAAIAAAAALALPVVLASSTQPDARGGFGEWPVSARR